MQKVLAMIITGAFVAGQAGPAEAALRSGSEHTLRTLVSNQMLLPVQQRGGRGGGDRSGTGPGTGEGGCPAQCRTVVEPGSGKGPQEVCERVAPRCRTVVEPGSGKGPQEVCDCP